MAKRIENTSLRSRLVTALIALAFGFGGAALWSATGMGHAQTRSYLLENPDILPEMAENFQKQQARERLADIADEVVAPFPGAVMGNPEGSVTLVEFTDYGCSFCRVSADHIASLIAKNPELRVVIREWPIFEGSDKAAQMALAAAEQGKFTDFHLEMFATGPPSESTIMDAAASAGLDLARAEQFIAGRGADYELSKNAALAKQLGFGGTPSWVVGDQVFEGAVGEAKLQEAIDAARES
ncbi:DsbA family protein [Pontixanthobacter aestiaquae]|uniref:Thioredoxin domain-containing protein n=1 Tax=Pontixanthobacter aestiaquae TaxID=1509367 RepID=A0A844Z2N5_9SPHN|nr:DsbA family protein [Pontixanthobacter aestiaquae]MDN3646823.1 DsbA family protein [Pontixanthobacter aestiaquae]MXO82195.1 thioredoxin domain-containing protein [Pontixanthobacter aestiaquae]